MGCNHSSVPGAAPGKQLHGITPSARIQPIDNNLAQYTPQQIQQYLQQQQLAQQQHQAPHNAPVPVTNGRSVSPQPRGNTLPPIEAPRRPTGKLEPLNNVSNKLPVPASPHGVARTMTHRNSIKATPCDNNSTHIATLYCKQCDESFCTACDATIHNRPKTRDHIRTGITSETGNTLSTPIALPRRFSHHSSINVSSNGDSSESNSEEDDVNAAALKKRARRAAKRKQKRLEAEAAVADAIDAAPTRFVAKDFSKTKALSTAASGTLQPYPSNAAARPHTPLAPGRAPQISQHTNMQRHASVTDGNYLNTVPIDKLRVLGVEQLNAIWNQYDCDGNGVLDRKELKLLANDCIGRTLKMFADEIRANNPGISEKNLQKAIEKERVFLLPGKNKEDSHREMTKLLIKKLDVNGDGGVTKQELMAQWKDFSNEVFAQKSTEALECSIM